MILLKLFINVLIIGLFLYSKLLPYKEKLGGQYKSIFNFFNSIFSPVLNGTKSLVKPFQVGPGLSVDMTQILLLLLLLLINNILR
ncbi:hypothetical protein BH11BAC3_BH11BAC3_46080 [soil metagenome]